MRLAMHVRYLGELRSARRLVGDLEAAGLDIFTVSESYTFDAVSQVGFLAAITQRAEIATAILNVYSRTAANIAMTAAGCDAVSGGRFILGLGTSGPQVVEGFHGVPYQDPVQRLRDYVEVTRRVLRREALEFSGATVTIPLRTGDPAERRRALKLISHPVRDRVPIWWAAIGSASVEAMAEVADGWLPAWWMPERMDAVFGEPLRRGLARRDPALGNLDISAQVAVDVGGDEAEVAAGLRPALALYVGGMGSPRTNFYNRLAVAYGFESEARRIQELYSSGRRAEAEGVVPEEWVRALTLAGPRAQVRDRLRAYGEAGVTVLEVMPYRDPVRAVSELRELLPA